MTSSNSRRRRPIAILAVAAGLGDGAEPVRVVGYARNGQQLVHAARGQDEPVIARLTGSAGPRRWFLDTEATGAGWGEIEGDAGVLLVGPEGGWDPVERRDLLAVGWRPVHLGERTLRLETAALASAALVLLPIPRRERDGSA